MLVWAGSRRKGMGAVHLGVSKQDYVRVGDMQNWREDERNQHFVSSNDVLKRPGRMGMAVQVRDVEWK